MNVIVCNGSFFFCCTLTKLTINGASSFFSLISQNHLEPYPHMCDIRFINGNNNKQHLSISRSHVQKNLLQTMVLVLSQKNLDSIINSFQIDLHTSADFPFFLARIHRKEIRRQNLHLNYHLFSLINKMSEIYSDLFHWIMKWNIRKFNNQSNKNEFRLIFLSRKFYRRYLEIHFVTLSVYLVCKNKTGIKFYNKPNDFSAIQRNLHLLSTKKFGIFVFMLSVSKNEEQ